MAAMRMSAWRVTAARSRVFEWQMVTVAEALSSIMAAGLPTMSERPTTTAFCPRNQEAAALQDLHDSGGSAGCEAGLARLEATGVDGVEAVHILVRQDGFKEAAGVDVFRKRKLDEDAVDVFAGVQAGNQSQHLFGGDGLRRGEHLAVDAKLAAGFDLAADVDL